MSSLFGRRQICLPALVLRLLSATGVMATVLLTGCGATMVTVDRPEQGQRFLSLGANLHVVTSREEAHRQLGTPIHTSEHLRLEIFHVEDKQVQIEALLPVIVDSREIHAFVMVLYDDAWRIKTTAGDMLGDDAPDNIFFLEYEHFWIERDGYVLTTAAHSKEGLMLIAPGPESENTLTQPPYLAECSCFL